MGLSEGARLAQYQIVGRLGAGGMGEVYRARDTKLNRDVAIKILLPAVASDPEHLARFTREAHVLAALNHPYIAHIYGLEDDNGFHALIMELVEGPTLADRLAEGPLRLEEALSVARQIAEALASAHGQGVVHRDLKPSNIKLRSDGTVKILDFGLAKALEPPDSRQADAADVPTLTSPAFTRAGVILGTAAYMSPEQARGQAVDKRTDIWAFGCVLFEMLTGRRAFPGETISDTIVGVLDRAPEWNRLPPATPSSIRRLLERTIEKRANRRLHDIADALLELDDATSRNEAAPSSGTWSAHSMRWPVAAITLAGVAALLAYLGLSQSSRQIGSDRFLPFASERLEQVSPAWSPDGRSVAYVATVDDVRQLFVKSVDADVPTRLTQSARNCRSPVWSPDGARIYYVAEQELWSIGAAGGQPQLVMKDVSAAAVAADGTIAFLRGVGGKQALWIAPVSGSPAPYRSAPFPEQFTRSNSVGFSRDGSKLAILIEHQSGAALTFELWIIPFPNGTPRRALGPFQSPTNPFDFGRISWTPDNRHLILQNTPPDEQNWHLHLIDTDTGGSQIVTSGTGAEWTPAVSPDGRRIAFASGLPDFDIGEVSIDSGEIREVLATGRNELSPTWSPTGTRFAYLTNVRGRYEVWLRSAQDDSSAPVLRRDMAGAPAWSTLERPTFSPDGQKIAYGAIQSDRHAVWVSSVAGGQPVPIDRDSVDQHGAAWSPDSNSIAYQRLRDGQWELVRAPLGGGSIVRIAAGDPGAGAAAWSPTGTSLAYVRSGALHLVSPDGSADRTLSTRLPAAFTFSRDGMLLYSLRRGEQRGWELASIDVRTGEERKVQALRIPRAANISGISLHPDGGRFITSVGTFRLDLWILERGGPHVASWRSLLRLE